MQFKHDLTGVAFLVVRNGKVLKHKTTSTQCIKTTYDKSILKEVDKWIKRYYSLELDQFRVDQEFFNVNNFGSFSCCYN